MERLRAVEHAQPMKELIEETFAAFAAAHPWVGDERVRPKSVAREMFEGYVAFNDYVNLYGLLRSEGVLLRYLSQVYKTAVQTVPPAFWTEPFEDALAYLHGLVRRTDASLVEEWQLLVDAPLEADARDEAEPVRLPSVADDPRALRARIRNELHTLVAALARRDLEAAVELVRQDAEAPWTQARFEEALAPFFAEHAAIDVTPRARQTANTVIREAEHRLWEVHHKILDPEGDDDFGIEATVDLRTPCDESGPLIELRRIGV